MFEATKAKSNRPITWLIGPILVMVLGFGMLCGSPGPETMAATHPSAA